MEAVSVVKSQEISGAGVILGSNIINSIASSKLDMVGSTPYYPFNLFFIEISTVS